MTKLDEAFDSRPTISRSLKKVLRDRVQDNSFLMKIDNFRTQQSKQTFYTVCKGLWPL